MNARPMLRFHHLIPTLALALTGHAMAHPGHHGEVAGHSESFSLVKHFFTHIDHWGPVAAVLLIAFACWRWLRGTSRS